MFVELGFVKKKAFWENISQFKIIHDMKVSSYQNEIKKTQINTHLNMLYNGGYHLNKSINI